MSEISVVFSCQQASEELCVNEMLQVPRVRFGGWLDTGSGLMIYEGDFPTFSAHVSGSIFLRHIFPSTHQISCTAGVPDSEAVAKALAALKENLNKKQTFSIQFRHAADEPHEPLYALRNQLSETLTAAGFSLKVDAPEQVISGYLAKGILHLGLSSATDNLSSWAGGIRSYAHRDDLISRAEFKLMEAIETFALTLPTGGTAVDLGAAPGGWTKVLLEKGMRVVAVDPAELAPEILENPNVTHYKGLAQSFLEENTRKFDLLVNDMRMDTADSVKIVCEMANCVRPGGFAIMTFKLPKTKKTAVIRKGLSLLEEHFTVMHKKQLFHNRSEITVVAYKF